ncbi:MAG TPA: helix-turn-helix transcriptional regulator [Streptosporangiaceae bacterium]|nr:helix-turn-helix transcriptional regulator [Streptosporangiaceae bacterium]
MAKNPPTVRMRRLGVELRKLREERGLTLDEAAELLSVSKSALNRMENAHVITRAHEVNYFIMMYEVTDKERRDALLGLASAGRSKDWVKRYGALSPDSSVADLVLLEQDSSAIRICQPFGIPGILQTPDYARAVKGSIRLDPARDIDREVAFRMARKEVLTRPVPVQLDVVIGEAALRQQMGGAGVLREQLRHLLDASRPANVTVRVLPYEAARHPGFDGPFTMLDVEAGHFTVVVVDGLARSVYLEHDDDVGRYRAAFAELRAVSLSAADSRTLIERVLDELEAVPEEEAG